MVLFALLMPGVGALLKALLPMPGARSAYCRTGNADNARGDYFGGKLIEEFDITRNICTSAEEVDCCTAGNLQCWGWPCMAPYISRLRAG